MAAPGFKAPDAFNKKGPTFVSFAKFAIVIGRKIRAEAKIIGITPPALSFKGK